MAILTACTDKPASGTNSERRSAMYGSTNFPFNFANRNGIPLIEASGIEVTDTNVVLNLPQRAFRFLNDKGLILFRMTQAIPSGTTQTLPVVFSSSDFTQPLTNTGGTPITVAQVSATGVYLIYYDKGANLMQLVTTTIPA